jgi:hypothetical protein
MQLAILVLLIGCGVYSRGMDNEIVTVDSFRKWTKDRLKGLKVLQKQLSKSSTDPDAVVKGLDDGWKDFRKKARALKAQSRNAASYKNRLVKQATRDSRRFTKILAQLTAK